MLWVLLQHLANVHRLFTDLPVLWSLFALTPLFTYAGTTLVQKRHRAMAEIQVIGEGQASTSLGEHYYSTAYSKVSTVLSILTFLLWRRCLIALLRDWRRIKRTHPTNERE